MIEPNQSISAGGKTYSPREVRALLQKLASLGINRDKIIAQINPEEAALLKRLGGSGKINPRTGLLSFDDGDGGGDDGGGDDGGGDDGEDGGYGGGYGDFDAGAFADAVAANNEAMTGNIADALGYGGGSNVGGITNPNSLETDPTTGLTIASDPAAYGNMSNVNFNQAPDASLSLNDFGFGRGAGAPTYDYSGGIPGGGLGNNIGGTIGGGYGLGYAGTTGQAYGPAYGPAEQNFVNGQMSTMFDPSYVADQRSNLETTQPSLAANLGNPNYYAQPAFDPPGMLYATPFGQAYQGDLPSTYQFNAPQTSAVAPATSGFEVLTMSPEEMETIFGSRSPDSVPPAAAPIEDASPREMTINGPSNAPQVTAAPSFTFGDPASISAPPASFGSPAAPASMASLAPNYTGLGEPAPNPAAPPDIGPPINVATTPTFDVAPAVNETPAAPASAPAPSPLATLATTNTPSPAGVTSSNGRSGTSGVSGDLATLASLGIPSYSPASTPGLMAIAGALVPSFAQEGIPQPAAPASNVRVSSRPDNTNFSGRSYTPETYGAPIETRPGLAPQTVRDQIATARGIVGEARNQDRAGQIAVANVGVNRAQVAATSGARGGERLSAAGQFDALNQFSWHTNSGDRGRGNRNAVGRAEATNSPEWQEAMDIAAGVISGRIGDNTKGSTHYHTQGGKPPSWSRSSQMQPTVKIGDHVFYRENNPGARSTDRPTPPSDIPDMPPSPGAALHINDISKLSTYPRSGEPLDEAPKAVLFHHTAINASPSKIVDVLNQQKLGVQYIIDRDGAVYQSLPEGSRGAHFLASKINDLNNGNTIGVEMIAEDNKDVTPQQVYAAQTLYSILQGQYPSIQGSYGHGQLNPGRRQESEGMAAVNAIRGGAAAPIETTTPAVNAVPVSGRNLSGYMGRDAPARISTVGPRADAAPAASNSLLDLVGKGAAELFGIGSAQAAPGLPASIPAPNSPYGTIPTTFSGLNQGRGSQVGLNSFGMNIDPAYRGAPLAGSAPAQTMFADAPRPLTISGTPTQPSVAQTTPDVVPPQDKAANMMTTAALNAAIAMGLGPIGSAANLGSYLLTGQTIGGNVADYLDPKAGTPVEQLGGWDEPERLMNRPPPTEKKPLELMDREPTRDTRKPPLTDTPVQPPILPRQFIDWLHYAERNNPEFGFYQTNRTPTPYAAHGGYFDADAYFADGGLVSAQGAPVQPMVASMPTMAYTDGQGLVGAIAAPPGLTPYDSYGSDVPSASPMAPAPAAAAPSFSGPLQTLGTRNTNAAPVPAPISQNPNLGYSLGLSGLRG